MKSLISLGYLFVVTFTAIFGIMGFLYVVSYMGEVEKGIEKLVLGQ
jgi:hypothetical protein